MKMLVLGDFQGKFPEKLRKKLRGEEFDLIIGVGDYGGIDDWRPWLKEMFKQIVNSGEYMSAEEYFGKKKLRKIVNKDEKATKNVLKEINNLGKKVIFVFGNSDDEWYDYPFAKGMKVKKGRKKFIKDLKNFKDITYGRTEHRGLRFAGFGGYMDVKANWNKRDGERLERAKERVRRSGRRLNELLRKKIDILVLHYPPKGIFDIIKDKKNPYNGKSAGIDMFRKEILKRKPKIVLCGHMHEYQGAKKLGKSLVINPGDAEKGKYAVVEISNEGKIRVRFIK